MVVPGNPGVGVGLVSLCRREMMVYVVVVLGIHMLCAAGDGLCWWAWEWGGASGGDVIGVGHNVGVAL